MNLELYLACDPAVKEMIGRRQRTSHETGRASVVGGPARLTVRLERGRIGEGDTLDRFFLASMALLSSLRDPYE